MLGAVALVLAACAGGASDSDGVTGGGSADPDPDRIGPQGRVAQFVVECELSHYAFDDPIVLPWQPGKSHLHMFFGNRDVTSDPGYDNLLAAETSCEQQRDTASYWAPALLDPQGRPIEPIGMAAYYRPGKGVDPADVVAFPEGLMLIGGDSGAGDSQSTDIVAWSCGSGAIRDSAPSQCSETSSLRMIVIFPDCWDGGRLTGFGSSAHARYSDGGCPESHPVAVPQLTLTIDYPPVDPVGLSLASGGIETAHADFWNVWDQAKLEEEVQFCINRDLVCGVTG
jgi:hypothetical protein